MPQHKDRRSERRANAGRPDKPAAKPQPPTAEEKPVVAHGAPLSTPKPSTRPRPKVGPADDETRRREIERRVQEGKDASEQARADEVKPSVAPKPPPKTIGKPGRPVYDVLRDRGKDTDEAVEREQ